MLVTVIVCARDFNYIYILCSYECIYYILFLFHLNDFGCCGRSIIVLVDALVVCDGDVGVECV